LNGLSFWHNTRKRAEGSMEMDGKVKPEKIFWQVLFCFLIFCLLPGNFIFQKLQALL
jgi:hypothetical protein